MLVRLSADEGAAATWAMIELQGEVERKDGGSMEEAFDVGTLAVTSSGAVMLTIGYHQVEGKRMELKKPYAVLNRMRGGGTDRSAGGGSTSGGGGEGQKAGGEGEEEDGGAAPEYKVVGVVRERILFKTRPRALITKPGGEGGSK